MKKYFKILFGILMCIGLVVFYDPQEKSPFQIIMDESLWTKSVLFIVTPSPQAHAFRQQKRHIDMLAQELRDHVRVVEIISHQMVRIDAKIKPNIGTQSFYKVLKIDNDGFQSILFGKNGERVFQKESAITTEELKLRVQ